MIVLNGIAEYSVHLWPLRPTSEEPTSQGHGRLPLVLCQGQLWLSPHVRQGRAGAGIQIFLLHHSDHEADWYQSGQHQHFTLQQDVQHGVSGEDNSGSVNHDVSNCKLLRLASRYPSGSWRAKSWTEMLRLRSHAYPEESDVYLGWSNQPGQLITENYLIFILINWLIDVF